MERRQDQGLFADLDLREGIALAADKIAVLIDELSLLDACAHGLDEDAVRRQDGQRGVPRYSSRSPAVVIWPLRKGVRLMM